MKNKKLLLSALFITMIGAGILTSSQVLAQNTPDGQNPMQSLVQKIADKFGLKKEDVQAVFDQDRSDRQAEMETKKLAELDQLVKDGKITEAQKQLIINKQKERETNRQTEMQTMQGKTDEERKAAFEANKTKMQTERKALEDWATQNGIDVKYLMGGFGGHGGPGGPGGPGPNGDLTPPAKPTS